MLKSNLNQVVIGPYQINFVFSSLFAPLCIVSCETVFIIKDWLLKALGLFLPKVYNYWPMDLGYK